MKRSISIAVVGAALITAAVPFTASAHSIPKCDRDYHVTISMDTLNTAPVWRDWKVVDTATGVSVRQGTTPAFTKVTEVSVDLPETIQDHPVQVYASENYSHDLIARGAPTVCGKAPALPVVVTPVTETPVQPTPVVEQPAKPSKPVVKKHRTHKTKKHIFTCGELKKKGAGRFWYTKLQVPYYDCHVNPRPFLGFPG